MQRAIIYGVVALSLTLACTKNLDFAPKDSCQKLKGQIALHESQQVLVTKIADGDTFTGCIMPDLAGSVRVRVLGIDCPESHENAKCKREGKSGGLSCAEQIPKGRAATAVAREMILGNTVVLESPKANGEFERDTFGRILAYVRTSKNDDFGKRMIKEGLCDNYDWKYPHPRGVEYGQNIRRMGWAKPR